MGPQSLEEVAEFTETQDSAVIIKTIIKVCSALAESVACKCKVIVFLVETRAESDQSAS